MFKKNVVYETRIPVSDGILLDGTLYLPEKANNLVIFVHGSGSSRRSPRNMYVAKILQKNNIGTLLIDLLTQEEDETYSNRFDIALLTRRVLAITAWIHNESLEKELVVGYFGASTGAAAAFNAAAYLGYAIKAIVSRGGRPDLAEESLIFQIQAPTLLLVGEKDDEVLELNKTVYNQLACIKKLEVIPNATHLFEEPGALEIVAEKATKWFEKYLR